MAARVFKEKIILGIDPGTNVMGFGAIKIIGKSYTLLNMDSVKINQTDTNLKLKVIFEKTLLMIDEYKPDEMAIEAPFFGKNVQSMLKLGRAQGVTMAAAMYREVPITEYSPRKVKQSITGSGAASKEQVAAMLQKILKIETLPKHLDATDGLAVAMCHHFQTENPIVSKGKGNWSAFVKNNPDKIK